MSHRPNTRGMAVPAMIAPGYTPKLQGRGLACFGSKMPRTLRSSSQTSPPISTNPCRPCAHSWPRRPCHGLRPGAILLVVLIVTSVLSLAAYTFSQLMLAEYEASLLYGRKIQARALAESGLAMTTEFLRETHDVQLQYGGHYDNPRFSGQLVFDGGVPADRGRFTIIAPRMDEEGRYAGLRYGLEDESARLNLQALLIADAQQENGGRDLLMALPGMTESIADAILDWIDEDDEPREFGAESEYYQALAPPYLARNGAPETVEELLLVKDMTPGLLFGPDANRNGMIDASEAALSAAAVVDETAGDMTRGWSAYLTLYSAEKNVNPDGEPRIDLNQDDLQALHDALSEQFEGGWADFIVVYRQAGPASGNSNEKGEPSTGGAAIDFTKKGSVKLNSVLDLIGVQTQLTPAGDAEPITFAPVFPDDMVAMGQYLPKLLDYAAVNTAELIPGRLNVNQAPKALLLGLPGIDEDKVSRIISARQIDPFVAENEGRRHETWLLTEGIVELAEMKRMLPLISSRGDVYRAQIVGYYDEGGPPARIEAMIDGSRAKPRLVFWRDISHLGRGYSLSTLGQTVTEGTAPGF